MLFGWKRPPKFRGPTFSKAIFGSSGHFPASLSIVRRKTEPLIFYIQLFDTQHNLTKFVLLIHKWIVANSIWLIFELYTNLRTSPRKKFDVNITTLIVVYKTVLVCIRHGRLLICCQMKRQSLYYLSGYRISLDLCPLDRSICQVIQDRVYQEKSDNVDELKQRIVRVCNEMEQTFDRWRKRLQICVRPGSCYLEHLMWFCPGRFIRICWRQRQYALYRPYRLNWQSNRIADYKLMFTFNNSSLLCAVDNEYWNRHRASTSMYSLTFRVRVMLP